MKKIEELDFSKKIEKQELMDILKNEASQVNITNMMDFYVNLVAAGKYVQKYYLKDYIEAYVKGFLLRVNEIKANDNHYEGFVPENDLKNALNLLDEMEKTERSEEIKSFFMIYKLISIYTTFILDEPIHIVGTLFPGGFRVKYENKIYYCPVKENNKDNPKALCGFCIAEQDESV
jgi:uncharacterized protein (UPF0305 family)